MFINYYLLRLVSFWLSVSLFDLACRDIVFLCELVGTVPLSGAKVVPASGCSRAHASYYEWQFTLDPRREPHVNVPEVVGDEISSPQGHEED